MRRIDALKWVPAGPGAVAWGLAGVSLFMILGPLSLQEPFHLTPYLLLFVCSILMFLRVRVAAAQRGWNKLLSGLLLAGLSLQLIVLMLLIAVLLLLEGLRPEARRVDCGAPLECRVQHQGAFGSYWQILSVRHRYLGLFYTETALTQFDREVVNAMRFDPTRQRVILEVQEYGKPPRTVDFALPG